jgi:hypothetical protein
LSNLTINLVNNYSKYSPLFKYTFEIRNFGKILTDPPETTQNNNMDNLNGDYVFRVGDEIYSTELTESLKSRKYTGIVIWLKFVHLTFS